jgi:hypothetical protein
VGRGIAPGIPPCRRGGIEEAAGCPVRQDDAPLLVEADDPGRDAREHGLGEAPPRVELLIGVDQLAALVLQLQRHAVEGAAEDGDLVVVRRFGTRARRSPS